MMKTTFTDAIVKDLPRGSASTVPTPAGGTSPVTNLAFKDAVATQVPNTRSGGLLPEKQVDNGFSYSKPPADIVEPGKTFKLG